MCSSPLKFNFATPIINESSWHAKRKYNIHLYIDFNYDE